MADYTTSSDITELDKKWGGGGGMRGGDTSGGKISVFWGKMVHIKK